MSPLLLSSLVWTLFYAVQISQSQPPSNTCEWAYDICSAHTPVDPDPDHGHWDLPFNMTDKLKAYNITNIKFNGYSDKPEKYFGYPHIIKIYVVCNGLDGKAISRQCASIGVRPMISIQSGPVTTLGAHCGYIKHTFSPILVDQVNLRNGSTEKCKALLCEPVWLVPLVRDWRFNFFNIEIKETYLGTLTIRPRRNREVNTVRHLYPSAHALLYNQPVAYIRSINRKKRSESDSHASHHHSNLLNVKDSLFSRRVSFKYIAGRSHLMGFAGFKEKNVVVISYDFFSTYQTFEVSFTEKIARCQNTNGVTILDIISLTDIFLLHTKFGLYEVVTYKEISSTAYKKLTLAGCFKTVFMSEQPLNPHGTVVAIGGEGNSGEIHAAVIPKTPDSSLDFAPLKASNVENPCDMFTNIKSCSIHDGAVTAIPERIISLFFKLVDNNGHQQIGVAEFSGELTNGNWRLVSQFVPSYYKDKWDQRKYYYIHPSVDHAGTSDVSTVEIDSLVYSRYVGSRLSFLGNSVLDSFDRGNVVFMIKKTFNPNSRIESYDNSPQGLFAYLNTEQEIWLGQDGVEVIKLNSAWNLYHDLSVHEDDHVNDSLNDTDIAVFFRGKELYKLVAYTNSKGDVHLRRLYIPYAEVLSGDAFARSFPLLDNTIKVAYGCPFRNIFYETKGHQKYSRIQKYFWAIPREIASYAGLQSEVSLLVANALMHRLMAEDYLHEHHYYPAFRDHIETWQQSRLNVKPYIEYVFRNSDQLHTILIDDDDFRKVYDDENVSTTLQIPEYIYLDINDTYRFRIWLSLEITQRIETEEESAYTTDDLMLAVTVSNRTLLKVVVEHTKYPVNKSVLHTVSLIPNGNVIKQQGPPGEFLLPVSVVFKVWNSDFKCFANDDSGLTLKGLQTTTVLLGCPPESFLVFDYQGTLAELPKYKERHYDCQDPETEALCIYFLNGFYPLFTVIDHPSGNSKEYNGRFTIKVIGEGIEKTSLKNYTEEEIKLYNSHSPVYTALNSLVFSPMDEKHDSKTFEGFPIYTRKDNRITWLCQEYSPCGNVMPKWFRTPEMYFLLEVSNRVTEQEVTFCDYTMQFLVKVHGLPMALIPTNLAIRLVFILVFVTGLMVYYLCKKNDYKVWRKCQNLWTKVPVKVHTPKMKSLFTFESGRDEEKKKRKRGSISISENHKSSSIPPNIVHSSHSDTNVPSGREKSVPKVKLTVPAKNIQVTMADRGQTVGGKERKNSAKKVGKELIQELSTVNSYVSSSKISRQATGTATTSTFGSISGVTKTPGTATTSTFGSVSGVTKTPADTTANSRSNSNSKSNAKRPSTDTSTTSDSTRGPYSSGESDDTSVSVKTFGVGSIKVSSVSIAGKSDMKAGSMSRSSARARSPENPDRSVINKPPSRPGTPDKQTLENQKGKPDVNQGRVRTPDLGRQKMAYETESSSASEDMV